ncbi:MAG: hypothetical protein UT98_C0003G0008 [Candidatus Nomurabacteria bacterium GW2011_GWF2_40_31]|uniref:Pilus assembly protein, PilO n=2 Tax=Candidatus Nomuraibacteriota TaxID=1752729 RepID=A0A837HVT3_9BACT|nr:MAG: hypothetical protein UT27_C0008G0007 [Candidatus Nomurabacteria bacterium GW2011_GWD2_39_12]KKR20504.1 MAG: hypothetical protein UT51_C0003G0008 [Candidatus Nomurabacteria bacterium GW2011_GWC2_39_41]KKR36294.1 MAG: hypothetical protein UT70_C0017G0006 [Candidatus Nomurabacteria bacterium GW2011_GWE2_40_10]KKR38470.1 MAG: hypothetical protein UT73_C0003G0110 [Candidatus Nomurabacteria bacterium GW2011_GWB1_40_11]KKR39578.1 MAG: hypothetical protein UT74_C0009G0016 [Parcubacteria group b
MFRFIMPVILIGIAVTTFFMFTNPVYKDISELRAEVASYNEALDNSKALENERDKLTAKYNSIDPDNLAKLQKLLPESIDNIRLILEIEKIALPYGMVLRDVKYNATEKKPATVGVSIQGGAAALAANKDYGIWNLEFSTEGSYNNFINFTKDLESNLRIVDISSIDFISTDTRVNSSTPAIPFYKYTFKIKTYWLKN